MSEPRLIRVAGALAEARPLPGAGLYELARVGRSGLLAEVIRLSGDTATLQVFEDTAGLEVGEPVELAGRTLEAELGPGLLGATVDGVGRPLARMLEEGGPFVEPGIRAASLDRDRRWEFEPRVEAGTEVAPGDVLGVVSGAGSVEHRILVPPGTRGVVGELRAAAVTVEEEIGRMEDGTPLRTAHRWPIRRPRPVVERLPGDRPFVTGQRVLDLLFPVAEGGSVAVPGGFGTGKTVIEQSLAKYGDADVVVFVACGERGNEIAEMLSEFGELEDPRSGRPLMDRTVLVVNTSNMPVVARVASVYLAITVGEYFRDMGHRVAVMADSLSRWAEALREIGSRLQEMPGEEGYPTYLANRLARIYERAGRARVPGSPSREGALTFISAVSPPGGDFSEPVTQASLRSAGALWALDASLANQRHYPAVDWDTSYSLYAGRMAPWYASRAREATAQPGGDEGDGAVPTGSGGAPAADEEDVRGRVLRLLQRGAELREISGLVGPEALEDRDRLVLATARHIRELVLAQNAFDPVDAFCPPAKTLALAGLALLVHDDAGEALEAGRSFADLELADLRRAVVEVREAPEDGWEEEAARARQSIEEALAEPEGPAP